MSIKERYLEFILKTLQKSKKQALWDRIHQISLTKMNFGNGGDLNTSGELYIIQYLQKIFENRKQLVIFDVGANIGNYSKALFSNFGSKAIIYAFEPSKNTFEIFKKNTQNIPNLIANNIGMSNEYSVTKLYNDQVGSGLASVYQRRLDHFGLEMNNSEEIQLTTIDQFCKDNKINHIDFLKLDIEGHELNALKGAKDMIANNKIDSIQFEFGGCNIDSRTYFQDFYYLLKDKFTIYRILEDDLVEISNYRETMEIFITVNYLALRKEIL